MHLPDWLARCAENIPHHLAIQCGEVRWSFAELDQRVTRLARQLAQLACARESVLRCLRQTVCPMLSPFMP